MPKNQTKSEKEELITVKVTAKAEQIYEFYSQLQTIYPPESMSISKLLKNMHDPNYHAFCTIRLPALNIKKKAELEDSDGIPVEEEEG